MKKKKMDLNTNLKMLSNLEKVDGSICPGRLVNMGQPQFNILPNIIIQ